MSTHELKIWPEHFEPVRSGLKTAEFRKDDRDFKAYDIILFREFSPATQQYTGNECPAVIHHVTRGEPLPKGFCLLSIARANVGSIPKDFIYMNPLAHK